MMGMGTETMTKPQGIQSIGHLERRMVACCFALALMVTFVSCSRSDHVTMAVVNDLEGLAEDVVVKRSEGAPEVIGDFLSIDKGNALYISNQVAPEDVLIVDYRFAGESKSVVVAPRLETKGVYRLPGAKPEDSYIINMSGKQ